jgi:hypothetical protein
MYQFNILFLLIELELKINNATSENISIYLGENRINENPITIEHQRH